MLCSAPFARRSGLYDVTGAIASDERGTGPITVARFTVHMDRMIYHYNFNLDRRARLLAEHAADVVLDADMPREEQTEPPPEASKP